MIADQKVNFPGFSGKATQGIASGIANTTKHDAPADSFDSLLRHGRETIKQNANSDWQTGIRKYNEGAIDDVSEGVSARHGVMENGGEPVDDKMAGYLSALKNSLSAIDRAGSDQMPISGADEDTLQIGEENGDEFGDGAESELLSATMQALHTPITQVEKIGSGGVQAERSEGPPISTRQVAASLEKRAAQLLSKRDELMQSLPDYSEHTKFRSTDSAVDIEVAGRTPASGALAGNAATILDSVRRALPSNDVTAGFDAESGDPAVELSSRLVGTGNVTERVDLTQFNMRSEPSRPTLSLVSNRGQWPAERRADSPVHAWAASGANSEATAAAPVSLMPADGSIPVRAGAAANEITVGEQVLDRVRPEITAMRRADVVSSQMFAANSLTNKSVMTLQLYPVGLGRLQAQMLKENDTMKVELVVESKKTLELLNADIDALKSSMRALGVADENITVTMARSNTTGDPLNEDNIKQGFGDNQLEQSGDNREQSPDNGKDNPERDDGMLSRLDQPAEIRVRTHDGVHRITI